ncbi:MAG: ketopantoate reductase family protein [Actinobacteria bacterium]|nr:ketopantoate reductase family protein [Actinomycetota bacterium]
MRIAVIGAGAMGGIMSMLCWKAGMGVTVYDVREERLADIKKSGMRVTGALNGETFPEVGRAGEATAPFDVMVLAVGAEETGVALRPLSPFVHRDTMYVSVQDGSAVVALASMVGEERAFSALGWVSAFETTAGEVEIEEMRSLVLGSFLPGAEARLVPVVEAIEAVYPGTTRLAADLEGEMWRRLECAAAVSALCAIAGAVPQDVRGLDDLNAFCEEAAEECRQVAASVGRELPATISTWEDAVWHSVKPPMLRDVEAGRKTEVACLSGYVVERARAAGIAVPVNSAILTLVKEMQSGRHRPGETALSELRRRIAEEKGMSLL